MFDILQLMGAQFKIFCNWYIANIYTDKENFQTSLHEKGCAQYAHEHTFYGLVNRAKYKILRQFQRRTAFSKLLTLP